MVYREKFSGIDHNMGRQPWASALRLISRNALASGSARLTINASFRMEKASRRKSISQVVAEGFAPSLWDHSI
jgi:hypothetical protein